MEMAQWLFCFQFLVQINAKTVDLVALEDTVLSGVPPGGRIPAAPVPEIPWGLPGAQMLVIEEKVYVGYGVNFHIRVFGTHFRTDFYAGNLAVIRYIVGDVVFHIPL